MVITWKPYGNLMQISCKSLVNPKVIIRISYGYLIESYANIIETSWKPHGILMETSEKPHGNRREISGKPNGNIIEILSKSYKILMEIWW